jgi:glycosyltransferase involved in cell wall biosynthesis
MNVLLVVPWDDARGGVVAVVQNVARHLREAGHGVLLFHPGGLFLEDRTTKLGCPGVRLSLSLPRASRRLRDVLRTCAFPLLFVSTLVQLIWLLRSRHIDIVNLHYPHDNCVYFAICRRLLPIRLVSSVHGRDAFYQERPKARYSRAFRFILRSSDLLVLPSDAYRRKLLEAFPDVEDRAVFIHNGVDPAQFTPVDPRQRLRERHKFILCVAELHEYKAIDVLLRAAPSLLQSDPTLSLVLAGDGPLRPQLEALASSLGIRDQTMFLGTQGRHEIARLMQTCHLMVLPSRMEPFGIALIEAMACKAPVVASDVGGIPEIVQHKRSGLLVEPENPGALLAALRCVLDDPRLAEEMGENGRARVMERFCASHHGAAYLGAYASLLGADSARPSRSAMRAAPQPPVQ